MADAGRPTKFTPEVRDKIVDVLRRGNYRVVAADYAGVGIRTLNLWMKAGREDPDSEFGVFLRACLEAERLAEIEMVDVVRNAGAIDYKAAAWYLGRKQPERWGDRAYRELRHKGDANAPLRIEIITLDKEPEE